MSTRTKLAWLAAIALALLPRVWNALYGPLFYAYDEWAHASYVLFLDLYHALPYADQGWSYFHPPLYYAVGWAVAQFGGAESLLRTLSLVGGAASLATAFLAAFVVRRAFPDPDWLGVVAFAAVALLPVHVFTSGMIGNELLACAFGSAALTVAIRNEGGPRLARDVACGALGGLAALTKFSGLTMLAGIGLAVSIHHLVARSDVPLSSLMKRLFAIGGAALVVAGPFYLRNVVEYGNPVQFSRDFPPMSEVESQQEPGERGVVDFLQISPKLFVDPALDAPHLIHSVWGTLYLNVWFDTYGASPLPVGDWSSHEPRKLALARAFAWLGIVPTALAFAGFAAAAAGYPRRRRFEDLALPLLAVLCMASFALFAWRVPSWAAVKASYLMTISLPWAYFVARGVLLLRARNATLERAALAVMGATALFAALLYTSGLLLERREDKREFSALLTAFGEYDEARVRWLTARTKHPNSRIVADGLGAVELLAGRPDKARVNYRRALRRPVAQDPFSANRLAVAAALDGATDAAARLLEAATATEAPPELLVNRAALALVRGDAAAAEVDLRLALEIDPELVPALRNLAIALEARGEDASDVRARAERAATRAPRGFPYEAGNGDVRHVGGNRRFMLIAEPDGLVLYRPPRARRP